jgi:sporulation protein YlmC with PRC-barrel domain
VSQLIGKDVRNAKGEDLGDIHDVVIDLNSGRVHYAVLSFGGVLGLGDRLFAYPLRAFNPASDKDELVLNVDQSQLKNAPGFDKKQWPNWNDAEYRGKIDRPFGSPAATQGRFKRASELIGGDVKDAAGKDIGDIREIVVNLTDGSARYAVVEFDRGWFKSDKFVAVPMQSLKRTGDRDEFVLARTRAELEAAPSFDKDKWPNLNDPKYRADVDRYRSAYPTGAEKPALAAPAPRSDTVKPDSTVKPEAPVAPAPKR